MSFWSSANMSKCLRELSTYEGQKEKIGFTFNWDHLSVKQNWQIKVEMKTCSNSCKKYNNKIKILLIHKEMSTIIYL